jgi:hypothetical protein
MRLLLLAVLLWVGVQQQQQVGWMAPQVTLQAEACTDVLEAVKSNYQPTQPFTTSHTSLCGVHNQRPRQLLLLVDRHCARPGMSLNGHYE